jgi:hypothetical protein
VKEAEFPLSSLEKEATTHEELVEMNDKYEQLLRKY